MSETSEATRHYREMFEKRTPEELYTVAQIKRFMERLVGDAEFREKLGEHQDNPKRVADEYGIDIDPAMARPLYSAAHLRYRRTEEVVQWPLAVMWDSWIDDMKRHRDLIRETGRCAEVNPAFDAWRERQVMRCISELGATATSITHPIVAYELSEGCSVGCWFCGIAADRFKGWQPYTPEVAELWRGMLGAMVDLFGQSSQTGFCYWATDPADNPDYAKFIEDFYHVTGGLPQTTSAAPLKDLDLTYEVLGLFDRYRTVTNRFSIINFKSLRDVHDKFSAEELLGVELVQQQNEALGGKADAGRARVRRLKLQASGKADRGPKFNADHGTIACVSGFLVNLMERTVRLVAPTRADEVWPLGYRVYAEESFETAEDYRRVVEGMVERFMPMVVPSDVILGFRRDLEYRQIPGGFELVTNTHCCTFDQQPFARMMGDLIETGGLSTSQVASQVLQAGHNVFLVYEMLQELFDKGFLNDDPATGGIATGEGLRQAS
ncbi:MAG: radical SAM family RiPP maturation amino acid epimerase [Alphaproteobacteria bacterium]|nr:radical SAM family RiPP maturation amino acid epimerase [Rhodospirillaceae bacterium]MBT6202714.1 radical SAM family RiPP maturation amino acid epimerase [Rhodospirillaceae bacterium]MBT6509784.1 radical SAM family RiPP maturation amino acid epimerase [Rhodospirillaceae bacterium]MBT7647328.1 radical SAM family RiPP maturation amino acid epimerase [Rhodospirillaceae bacterium]MDG2480834.1 radical SAM family RiPP maturation amino acid epimerase [Alphaproteobacteria bacterium]